MGDLPATAPSPASIPPGGPKSPRHACDVTLALGSVADAAALRAALAVEMRDQADGARVALRADGAAVAARIEADGVPALRAALTGLLRLADAATRSIAVARGGPDPSPPLAGTGKRAGKRPGVKGRDAQDN